MTLQKILLSYFDIQNELRKDVEYHKKQEPNFKVLVTKIGKLCDEIRVIQLCNHTNFRVFGWSDDFFTQNGVKTDAAKLWEEYFDTTMLDREYYYLSLFKAKKLTSKIHRLSFWPTHQSLLLQKILIEWQHPVPTERTVTLLWLLLHSVYRQSRQFAKSYTLPNVAFPTLKDCFFSFTYTIRPQESTN